MIYTELLRRTRKEKAMRVVRRLHRPIKMQVLDSLTTDEVLRMHERVFGPLDPKAKRRIVSATHMRGWDRSWSDEGIAA